MPTKPELEAENATLKRQLAAAKGQITKLKNEEPEVKTGMVRDVSRIVPRSQILRLVAQCLPKGSSMPDSLTGDFHIKFSCVGDEVFAELPPFIENVIKVNNRDPNWRVLKGSR